MEDLVLVCASPPIVRSRVHTRTHVQEVPKKEKKFKIRADKRKGLLTLERNHGGMLELLWKLRPNATVLERYTVLPGEQTFEKVDTGREGDRVYLLQFKGQEKRRFFWMQEPNKAKDEDNVKQLQNAMKLPPTAGLERGHGGRRMQRSQRGGNNDQSNAVMQSLLSSLGGAVEQPRDSTDASSKDEESNNEPIVSADALQAALMAALGGTGAPQQQQREPDVPLGAVLRGTQLDEAVRDIARSEDAEDLVRHLPEGCRSVEELQSTTSSPQFSQAVGRLSAALQSDSYNAVVANFGLDPSAGAESLARGQNVSAFLDSVQASAENEEEQEEKTEDESTKSADA